MNINTDNTGKKMMNALQTPVELKAESNDLIFADTELSRNSNSLLYIEKIKTEEIVGRDIFLMEISYATNLSPSIFIDNIISFFRSTLLMEFKNASIFNYSYIHYCGNPSDDLTETGCRLAVTIERGLELETNEIMALFKSASDISDNVVVIPLGHISPGSYRQTEKHAEFLEKFLSPCYT